MTPDHDDNQRPMDSKCIQSKFVEPSEFLSLMLSRRVLVRSDDMGTGTRGLLDPETGSRFIVEYKDLLLAKPA